MIKVLDFKGGHIVDGGDGLEFRKTNGSSSLGIEELVVHVRAFVLRDITIEDLGDLLSTRRNKREVLEGRDLFELWGLGLLGDELLEF